MTVEPAPRAEMLATLPRLRLFALSLVQDGSRADDLVQGTIVRAWGAMDQFKRGTNLNAWLFTILRNLLRSEYRNRRREVQDQDGFHAARLRIAPDQQSHLDYEDMRLAFAKLQPAQREILLLVLEGQSYDDMAETCGQAVGTIKSRVNRARTRLAKLLHYEASNEIGPDCLIKAALQPEQ